MHRLNQQATVVTREKQIKTKTKEKKCCAKTIYTIACSRLYNDQFEHDLWAMEDPSERHSQIDIASTEVFAN